MCYNLLSLCTLIFTIHTNKRVSPTMIALLFGAFPFFFRESYFLRYPILPIGGYFPLIYKIRICILGRIYRSMRLAFLNFDLFIFGSHDEKSVIVETSVEYHSFSCASQVTVHLGRRKLCPSFLKLAQRSADNGPSVYAQPVRLTPPCSNKSSNFVYSRYWQIF